MVIYMKSLSAPQTKLVLFANRENSFIMFRKEN